MFIILNIFLVLCSLIFWPFPSNDSFWSIKETIFVLCALSIFSYNLCYGKTYQDFNNKFLALFFLYVAIGFIWFFYSSFITSNGKIDWNFWNFKPTINIICSVILIKILYENSYSLAGWVNTAKVIAWLGGIFAAYSIFQYFGIDQIFNKNVKFLFTNMIPNGSERMVTFFSTSFISSAFLAVCSPMCLIFKGIRYKFFYSLIFIALILMDRTIALGAFSIGLLTYLFMNKKYIKVLMSILCGMVICSFYFFKNPEFFSFTGREQLWILTLNKFLEAPFFGFGLGYYEMFKFKSGLLKVTFAHNEYLQNLIELGIVGSSIYLLFIRNIFSKVIHNEKNILLIGYTSGFVAFLFLCLGSFPIRIAPLALIAIIYITGILYQCKGVDNG